MAIGITFFTLAIDMEKNVKKISQTSSTTRREKKTFFLPSAIAWSYDIIYVMLKSYVENIEKKCLFCSRTPPPADAGAR